MHEQLSSMVPLAALKQCEQILKETGLNLKIVKKRATRHGDYKRLPGGFHQITVNAMANPYRFLITLVHEMAHYQAFTLYGRQIKPHGKEWKKCFKLMMLPFLRPEIFPEEILAPLARHMKNPKASSSTDSSLVFALQRFDPPSHHKVVAELPKGSIFKLYNGKIFKRGDVRVKRIACAEVTSGRIYLFQPHAEVELIKI